ncbi:MAG: Nramp family divalent metal transporter [Phycisphaerales bacterium]|nr:MAG: Nramp family divalent metal transporter [Phycisphaerales bacterium]
MNGQSTDVAPGGHRCTQLPSDDASYHPAVMPREAPQRTWKVLFWIGPGIVTTASVIGSGELIAVPVLGAKVGFAALWLIVISCLVKAVLQDQLGRAAIATGHPTLTLIDMLPVGRWRVNWLVWAWFGVYVAVTFQLGGIVAALAQGLSLLMPQLTTIGWTVVAVAVGVLLFVKWPRGMILNRLGRYPFLEYASKVLVLSLTVTGIASFVFLQGSPNAIALGDLKRGLLFDMPTGGFAIALAAFGITGAGTVELIMYPYWVCKKGYQRRCGPNDGSAQWRQRARGWCKVLRWDVYGSMLVYTTVTLIFYLLGAAILHPTGTVPEGIDTIRLIGETISYSFGPTGFLVFLLCASFALFSTYHVLTTHKINVLEHFIAMVRHGGTHKHVENTRLYNIIAVCMPLLYGGLAIGIKAPVVLVIIGGVAQTAFLLPIVATVLYHRYKTLRRPLTSSRPMDVVLWVSSAVIVLVSGYLIFTRIA